MAMDETDVADDARRRRGKPRWMIIAALLTVSIGWAVLWFLASSEASRRFDDWLAGEARRGRQWNCASRRIEGFPLQLRLVCDHPAYSGALQGTGVIARASSFSAGVPLWAPNHVEAEFGSPLVIEARGAGARLSAVFASLRLDVRLDGEALERATLSGEKIDAHWNEPSSGPGAGTVATFEFSAEPVKAFGDAVDVALASAGVSNAALDRFTNSPERASVAANARVSAAAQLLRQGHWTEAVENWRIGGGRLQIGRFALDKGSLALAASGEFRLDSVHRLEGRGEVGAKGANSILLRFGVPPAALGVANVLDGLLRGPVPGQEGRAPGIKLPFSFENGKGAIGPVRNVFVLEPLY